MIASLRRYLRALPAYVDVRLLRWRAGTPEGQRAAVAGLALASVTLLVLSWIDYQVLPAAWFFLPILIGAAVLQHRYLLILVGFVLICVIVTVTHETITYGTIGGRFSTLIAIALATAMVVLESSRNRSGLPSALSEAMLADLRDRLQAQGKVPQLPAGWTSQSSVLSASGGRYAGDFLVANLSDDESSLEMILVDVCGKGVAAGTQSLHFAGALGGLIGALPPAGLFAAANDFLLRQNWIDGFATAAHVIVDLRTGAYSILCAGHPPAMIWDADARRWQVDGARGTALGVTETPEFHSTTGVLEPGAALMFYTDGVVESKNRDVMTGIDWLRDAAGEAVRTGFDGAARRILAGVESGDDDRAVLILNRQTLPVVDAYLPPVVPAAPQPAGDNSATASSTARRT